jgi:hypothetical protein
MQIRIKHFRSMRIQIQGFDDQKCTKKLQLKKSNPSLDQKLQFAYPKASIKSKLQESLQPSGENSSTSTCEFSKHFLFFCGSLLSPGFGSAYPIQIQQTKINADPYASRSDTLVLGPHSFQKGASLDLEFYLNADTDPKS